MAQSRPAESQPRCPPQGVCGHRKPFYRASCPPIADGPPSFDGPRRQCLLSQQKADIGLDRAEVENGPKRKSHRSSKIWRSEPEGLEDFKHLVTGPGGFEVTTP